MTLPFERTRAVLYTKSFLEELLCPQKTPRIPRSIRGRAKALLRHYPDASDIQYASKWAADVFSPVLGMKTLDIPEFTFTFSFRLADGDLNQAELITRFAETGFTTVVFGVGNSGVLTLELTGPADNAQNGLFTAAHTFRELLPDAVLIGVTEQVVRVR